MHDPAKAIDILHRLDLLLAGLTCPACGAPAVVDRIAVAGSSGFLLGHWRCTRDPAHTSAG